MKGLSRYLPRCSKRALHPRVLKRSRETAGYALHFISCYMCSSPLCGATHAACWIGENRGDATAHISEAENAAIGERNNVAKPSTKGAVEPPATAPA